MIALFFRIIWQRAVPKVCLLGLLLAFSSPSVDTTTGIGSRGRAAGRLQPYYQCKRAICNGNCPWNGGIKQPPPKGSMDGSSDEARRKNRTPKSVKLPWEPQKLFGCLNWWWLDYKSGQESDTTTTRGDAMVRRLVFSSHVIAT